MPKIEIYVEERFQLLRFRTPENGSVGAREVSDDLLTALQELDKAFLEYQTLIRHIHARKNEPASAGKKYFSEKADIEIPEWLVAVGAEDHSHPNYACGQCMVWHNEKKYRGLRVWVNYENVEDREIPERFMVQLIQNEKEWDDDTGDHLYRGDDEQEAKKAVNEGLKRLKSKVRV